METAKSKQKKEESRQDRIDQIFKLCYPHLATTRTSSIDKKSMKIVLPGHKFIPDKEEDKTHTMIESVLGTKANLCIWKDRKEKELKVVYNKIQYTAILDDISRDILELEMSIVNGIEKIIRIATRNVTPSIDEAITGLFFFFKYIL